MTKKTNKKPAKKTNINLKRGGSADQSDGPSKTKVNRLLRAERRAKKRLNRINEQLLTGDSVLGDAEKVKLRAVRDALEEVFA